jgi:flagellar hook-associated protein 3 FlgL
MTIGRVTTSQVWASSNANIQSSKARLAQLSAQSSSGVLVTKPSDDPAASAAIMSVLNQQSATTQYGTNISDGQGWLSTADSTMTSATIQAANSGTSSPASRAALASQLAGVRDDLLSAANAQYNGRSVFAGTSDSSTAFDPTTFAYNGPTTSTTTTAADGTISTTTSSVGSVQRRIGPGSTDMVTVSADGLAAFGSGSSSVFAQIQNVIDALNSPAYTTSTGPQATVTAGIDALGTALTNLSAQHAVVGANYARMTSAKAQNATTATALETQRSGLQDADTTKTLLDLKTQELAYQTALQVTAQVIQPTLMSFLK